MMDSISYGPLIAGASVLLIGVLLGPMSIRLLIVASSVLVTANPQIPLHWVPIILVAVYFFKGYGSRPVRASSWMDISVICLGASLLIGLVVGLVRGNTEAADTVWRLTFHVVVFFVVSRSISSWGDAAKYLLAFVVGATAEGLFGIIALRNPELTASFGLGAVSALTQGGGTAQRMTGMHGDPNFFGLLLAVAAIYSVALYGAHRHTRLRFGLLIPFTVCAWGTVLTYSRSAIIGLFVGLILSCVVVRNAKRVVLITVCGAAVLTAVSFSPEVSSYLLNRMETAQGSALDERVAVWREVLARNPVELAVGGGAGARTSSEMSTHQTFLYFLLNTGILGASIYAALLVVPLITAFRIRQHVLPPAFLNVKAGVIGGLAVILFGSFFLDLGGEKATWVVLALAAGMPRRYHRVVPFRSVRPVLEPV